MIGLFNIQMALKKDHLASNLFSTIWIPDKVGIQIPNVDVFNSFLVTARIY